MRQRSRAPVRASSRAKSIADGLTYRRLTVDDLSNVRYLHSLACRCLPELVVGETDVEDYCEVIATPEYGDRLLAERHILAFCGHELVGSAGWGFGAVGEPVARLSSVFIHPFFTKLGIGRRLVEAVERDARNLGFECLTAPLPQHAGHFLRSIGFEPEAKDGVIAKAAPDLSLARRLVARDPEAKRDRKPMRRALSVVGQD